MARHHYSRLAIDRLRRLKTEREAYSASGYREPIVTDAPPDRHLDLADDLSIAFLTLLERLAPEERAAFLLHDVFDVGYPEIASVIEKSESACRQVVHRARERVRGDRKRFDVSESAKETLLQRFLAATEARDEQAVLALFAPDATWTADGGGKTAAACIRSSAPIASPGWSWVCPKGSGRTDARWRSRPSTARPGCASAMAAV